mgnify:CR=1 FL=1
MFGNVSLQYLPLSWLRFDYTLGVDYSGDDRLQGQPQTSSNIPDPLGQVVKVNLVTQQVDHNLTGTATYKLSPTLGGSFTLGQNLNTRSLRQVGGVGNALLAPEPFTLTNTGGVKCWGRNANGCARTSGDGDDYGDGSRQVCRVGRGDAYVHWHRGRGG